MRYTFRFGNASNTEASQCSLFCNFGELKLVSTSLPYIPVGDTAAAWVIGTLEPGECGQIILDVTLPQSPYRQYLNSPVPSHPIIGLGFLFDLFVGLLLRATGSWVIDEISPHPDLSLTKVVVGKFEPPSGLISLCCGNHGLGTPCENTILQATVVGHPQCLLDVSSPNAWKVDHNGDYWDITWRVGDLKANSYWSSHKEGLTFFGDLELSMATDPQCAHDSIILYAKANYNNEPEEAARFKGDNYIKRQKHEILFGWDPNEMVVYPENFIASGQTLYYTVFFENEGSAPAESIRIISKIDTNLTDQSLYIPDSSVVYNAFERKVDWNFPHINLQPDSSSFVSYVIQAKDNLESGTVINCNATIYFDYMPGVPCSVSVTVDALNPISQVDSVKWVSYPDTFEVFWSGYDPAPGSSGISSYSIYCSVDRGSDSLWFADTAWFEDYTLKTSAIFVADSGHYYGFTSIAMDMVWNIEEAPAHPDVYFPFLRGDAYRDGKLNVSDVIYIINYLFKGGPPPTPVEAADVNCDGKVNVTDVIYFINYLFKGGPPLC